MFCEGKTTGTFKSLDEPVYMSFVSIINPKIKLSLTSIIVHEELSVCF